MVSKGLKPSVATYNSMVDGWCKEGEIESAMSCVARMYEDERDPDVVTYTSLIHGLCASGRPGEAISRWNEMKGRGCCLNVITFMALVQGLCKCVWTSEALVYFREMEEKEMEPDSGVYVSLMSSFLLSGNISEGFGIFREMVCKGRFPVLVDRNYMVAVDATNKRRCGVLYGLLNYDRSVFIYGLKKTFKMHTGISQLDKAVKATQIHSLAHDKTYFDSKKIYAALHLVGNRMISLLTLDNNEDNHCACS
ncbi:putative pentatricopeptide repeat-containing protein At5g08310, mitochondrial [Brassica napus]|uniref:putative pentatricopeptide repeat-containing protein At5g08310, mitochondrial n=1 Tax=Brassica napus TaxID=3708 RepID=UPI002078C971|nr:putative pentatricopeptide repeat-containing protein At5g08310, mitochondrial [Brassica napus]